MKESILDIFSHEGMFLYLMGATTITAVHLYYRKDWVLGMKGLNGLWEAPEICLYIFFWIFPHIIMGSSFLPDVVKPPIEVWYFMGVLLLFGLTGRWGLEWLANFKPGSSNQKTDTETKKDETIN